MEYKYPKLTFFESTYAGNNLVPANAWELARNNTIFLEGMITPELADSFKQQLDYFEHKEDLEGPVKVIINSTGGSVTAGMAIIDAMKECGLEMDLVCMGEAYSMAAVILASGKKGHRFIYPNSMVMIHEVQINSGSGLTGLSSVEATAQLGDKFRKLINKVLADATGHTVKEIDEQTRHDHFMDATEAKKFGIVDKVL